MKIGKKFKQSFLILWMNFSFCSWIIACKAVDLHFDIFSLIWKCFNKYLYFYYNLSYLSHLFKLFKRVTEPIPIWVHFGCIPRTVTIMVLCWTWSIKNLNFWYILLQTSCGKTNCKFTYHYRWEKKNLLVVRRSGLQWEQNLVKWEFLHMKVPARLATKRPLNI